MCVARLAVAPFPSAIVLAPLAKVLSGKNPVVKFLVASGASCFVVGLVGVYSGLALFGLFMSSGDV